MGVAIADKPEGPYVKNPTNPLVPGGHDVLVWPYEEGVVALIERIGPFRPEAFMDNGKGQMIEWGVHIGGKRGFLPFLERFDYKWEVE